MHKQIESAKQMSVTERNTQLWAFLNGMGLYVQGIGPDGTSGTELEGKLDCLIVSVAPPTVRLLVAEPPASTCIGEPVQGAEIDDTVASSARDRHNVVDFPTVV